MSQKILKYELKNLLASRNKEQTIDIKEIKVSYNNVNTHLQRD